MIHNVALSAEQPPQLYARIQPGDLDASGGLLAANSIDLDVSGDLTNMGTLAGRQLVSLTADNIKNLNMWGQTRLSRFC